MRALRGQNWGGLPTSWYCPLLYSSSDVLQVRNTLVTMLSPVSHGSADIYNLFSVLMPLSLSLKDAELGTSNLSSLKIVEEPREPVSPGALEGIQVTEVTHPCVGPWAGHGGCLRWGCWLTTEF